MCDGKSGSFFNQAYVKASPIEKKDTEIILKNAVVWTQPLPFYVIITGDAGVEKVMVGGGSWSCYKRGRDWRELAMPVVICGGNHCGGLLCVVVAMLLHLSAMLCNRGVAPILSVCSSAKSFVTKDIGKIGNRDGISCSCSPQTLATSPLTPVLVDVAGVLHRR